MSTQQELKEKLEDQRRATKKLEQEATEMWIRNELEEEAQKAKALEASIKHMQETREAALAGP